MSDFVKVKEEFRFLCMLFEVPVPSVVEALGVDEEDVTDPPNEVRIKEDKGVKNSHHARHLFGHYLADLHAVNDEHSDHVASIIAKLINWITYGGRNPKIKGEQ